MGKKNLKLKATCIVFLLMILGIVVNVVYSSRRVIEEDTLSRNITNIFYRFDTKLNLSSREIAWDSELPKFVKEDIEYIMENSSIQTINYNFFDWKFYIRLDEENQPYIGLYNEGHPYIWNMRNFSLYMFGNTRLSLCGYDSGMFIMYSFEKDGKYADRVLTSKASLPFDEKESETITYGEQYLICFSKYKDLVYVYRDGEIVSPKYSFEKPKQTFDNGMIITEDNELEMLYIIPGSDGKVKIRVESIGKVPQSCEQTNIKVKSGFGDYLSLPIFIDEFGQNKIPIPQDWNTFILARNGIFLENPNYAIEFESLGRANFKRAIFRSHAKDSEDFDGIWNAEIFFDLNGKETSIKYLVNGYDRNVKLPQELPKEKAVYSIDEFWNFINQIREAYTKYYDYPKSAE